jgi:hypothetical protein
MCVQTSQQIASSNADTLNYMLVSMRHYGGKGCTDGPLLRARLQLVNSSRQPSIVLLQHVTLLGV